MALLKGVEKWKTHGLRGWVLGGGWGGLDLKKGEGKHTGCGGRLFSGLLAERHKKLGANKDLNRGINTRLGRP